LDTNEMLVVTEPMASTRIICGEVNFAFATEKVIVIVLDMQT